MTAARTWVIDAANVMGARPDGWWRDRPAAAVRLYQRLLRLTATADWPIAAAGQDKPPAMVVLVVEGAAKKGVEPGTVPLSAQGTVPLSAQGTVPLSAQGTVPLSAQGTVPLSAQGTVPLSAQGAVPLSAQGAVPLSGHSEREGGPTEAAGEQPAVQVRLTVVHATGAGDDAIVDEARAAEPPVLVFTSDRALRERLVESGARVRGSGALWALLDET